MQEEEKEERQDGVGRRRAEERGRGKRAGEGDEKFNAQAL
jgi:hypothetical protein